MPWRKARFKLVHGIMQDERVKFIGTEIQKRPQWAEGLRRFQFL